MITGLSSGEVGVKVKVNAVHLILKVTFPSALYTVPVVARFSYAMPGLGLGNDMQQAVVHVVSSVQFDPRIYLQV